MPFQHKSHRYQKRSDSSSSHHEHRRDRRTYDKEKGERIDKYHRRSRSRTPPKEDNYKGKYTYHYQHKEDRRYYDHYRDADKNKQYDHNSTKRDQFEKRDREKGDQYAHRPKYGRFEEKESSRPREKDPTFEKRERTRNSPEHERRRRKSSSSHSKSSSRKEPKRNEGKPSYSKHNSTERYREHERRSKRSVEKQEDGNRPKRQQEERVKVSPQKEYKSEVIKPVYHDFPPPPKPFVEKNSPTIPQKPEPEREEKSNNKPLFKLKSIPPPPPPPLLKTHRQEDVQRQLPRRIERSPEVIEAKPQKQEPNTPIKRMLSQVKQVKPQSPLIKTKVSKFDQLLSEARQNLAVPPPKSTFLMLQAFRTMNKFQVQTLDPKWMNFLKKDMEKYQQQREAIISNLVDAKDEYELTGQQFVWMKEERNQQDLDLKFRFEQFKQHNANLNQMIRRLRFLD